MRVAKVARERRPDEADGAQPRPPSLFHDVSEENERQRPEAGTPQGHLSPECPASAKAARGKAGEDVLVIARSRYTDAESQERRLQAELPVRYGRQPRSGAGEM